MSNVYGSSKSKAQITCRCSLFYIMYFMLYLAPIIQSIPIFTHTPMERKIWNSGQVSLLYRLPAGPAADSSGRNSVANSAILAAA